MIIKFVFLIVFFMAHYNFKFSNSNYMLIQINDQSHNHIVNSNTSKIKAQRLYEAIGKKLISAFESHQINIECKCSHGGKCEPKGCKSKRASSRSIGGDGYIPEKCRVHLIWAHSDGWGWNKGPGKLWPEADEWYKDMKKQTGVEPRDGSFEDFQRIFKCNGIHAYDCNNIGLQFPLTCSYPPCNTCNENQPETDGIECCREKGVPEYCSGYCLKETKETKSRAITGACEEWLKQIGQCRKAPSESDIDDNSPWYTFGYGSLLSSSSRIISECGLRGQQEDYIEWSIKNLNVDVIFNQEKAECIRQKQAKQFIQAEIRGYRRGWYSKGKLPQKDMKENSLFIRPTFLGLVKDEKYNATGLLYSTTIQDLKRTDEREKGAGYMHETLSQKDFRLYSNANIPDDAKIRVYTSGPDQIDSPTKRFPIVQSYVDVFLGGAIEIEENNPKLQNFSLNTCKQTYGWSGGWVNDRPYPRHRAGFLSIRAEKIDNLLYQCMKDNELSEDEHKDTVQSACSLRPLHSTDLDDIKFPGECDRGNAAN